MAEIFEADLIDRKVSEQCILGTHVRDRHSVRYWIILSIPDQRIQRTSRRVSTDADSEMSNKSVEAVGHHTTLDPLRTALRTVVYHFMVTILDAFELVEKKELIRSEKTN